MQTMNMTDHNGAGQTLHRTVTCPLREIYIATFNTSVPYFVTASVNALMAVATTVANLVVLLAMRHVTSIRLPSKLLLCSLVLTDLCTGVVVQPQFVMFLFIRGTRPGPALCSLYFSWAFSGAVFTCASLLALTVIGLDRYAARFFHLKYHQIVTTRRVCAVLAFIWVLSFLFASTCLWDYSAGLILGVLFIVVAFFVTSVVYMKIFRSLRALQQVQPPAPDQAQQEAGNPLNMERYRTTASAMMWVYVLFIVCYVPWSCAASVTVFRHTVVERSIQEFAYTFLYLNSLLNPLVYYMCMPKIRAQVVKQLRKLSCQKLPWRKVRTLSDSLASQA